MPLLMSLLGGLLSIAGSFAGRILVALSVGYVTYKGVDVSTQFLMDQIRNGFAGMPVDLVNFLAFCWIDKAISLVSSTWSACMAVSGLAGGITKFKIKGAA